MLQGEIGQVVIWSKQRLLKKLFNPKSLISCCVNFIKSNDFPKQHIQIPITSLWQIENHHKWFSRATILLQCFVLQSMPDEGRLMEFFSYLEFCGQRSELEFRTFDFMHVLTNFHTQILTRGRDYCKIEHFEHLSTNKPGSLSLALVFEKTDQQNAFTAMCMFNYDVFVNNSLL